MKNVLLICRKELNSYFASPIAYILMTAFGLIFGWVFANASQRMVSDSFMAQMQGGMGPMNVNEWIIRPLLGFASTVALFLIPMITMRTFAEEKKTGTIELLLTSPVSDVELILGKWLGAMLLYLCVLGMSVIDLALLYTGSKPDLLPTLVAYLGLILQGGALLGIGLLISAFTKNQIVAGGVTFFACLLLWLLSWTEYGTSWWAQTATYLSIITHFENLNKGVLESKDVIYYISLIFFSLFLTSRAMESLRWRA